MDNPHNYRAQVVGIFFVCQEIPFGSCALAVFVFSTLLADIQRSIWKSTQGLYPVGRVIYSWCPLYSLNLLCNLEHQCQGYWDVAIAEQLFDSFSYNKGINYINRMSNTIAVFITTKSAVIDQKAIFNVS